MDNQEWHQKDGHYTRITAKDAEELKEEALDPYPHYYVMCADTVLSFGTELYLRVDGPDKGDNMLFLADGTTKELHWLSEEFMLGKHTFKPQRITDEEAEELKGEELYPRVFVDTANLKDAAWLWKLTDHTHVKAWHPRRHKWMDSSYLYTQMPREHMHEVTGYFTAQELLDGANRERCGVCGGEGKLESRYSGPFSFSFDKCAHCEGSGVEPDTTSERDQKTIARFMSLRNRCNDMIEIGDVIMQYTPPKPEIKQIEIEGEDRLGLVTTDGYSHSTIALLEDVIELLSKNGIKVN